MNVYALKDYVSNTSMTFSYKAVMLLALLDAIDQDGKASHSALIRGFHNFYLQRQRQGLPTERARERNPTPLLNPAQVSDTQIWQILSRYPLELMGEFITVDNDYVRINPALWSQMTAADFIELRELLLQRIERYYEEIE
jgi:hypothetical protein